MIIIPEKDVIHDSIKGLLKTELFIDFLLGLLIATTIFVCIYICKAGVLNSRLKSISLIILVICFSVGLIILRLINFIPLYSDYKNLSYVVEENAKICIIEGTNNLLEQKNEVKIETRSGEKIKLEITNDYKFETGIAVEGTIVYTKRSKQIIWYKTERQGDG